MKCVAPTTGCGPARVEKHVLFVLLVATYALGCGGDGPAGPISRSPEPTLEEWLSKYQRTDSLPAIAAAIVRSDSIEEAAAVGVRRLGFQDSVTLDDRFHIGSNTKAMVATVAATLVEDGVLDWLVTPAEVFPDLADTIHPDLRSIALRDLFMHRAGLQPFNTSEEIESVPDFPGTPIEQRRAFVAWLLSQPPWGMIGEYAYSNAGYSVAGAMLEEITGQSWDSLLRERLFTPLGMTTAGFGWPARDDPNQPWGHWLVSGSLYPHPPNAVYKLEEWGAPAGDVHVSIADYARFVQMHLRGLLDHDGVLKSETVRYLHSPNGRYALGWAVDSLNGHMISLHTGSAGTFVATMAISRSSDLGVVIATNAGGATALRVCGTLLDILVRRYSTD